MRLSDSSLCWALPGEIQSSTHAEAAASPARFTLDGDDALEAHLAQTCRRVRAGVQKVVPRHVLEAVLLGGGYGRGEGGVLRSESGDQPYNDLEFYVLLRGHPVLNDWRYRAALEHLAHELTPQAGIEVEFKILSLGRLRRDPVSMFSYDLVRGHRWVIGHESMLEGCAHHLRAADIPLAEATRLLMNRCSGLLFARERLVRANFSLDDADFIGRNLAKARLALGDALLAAMQRYHGSARERQRRLAALGSVPDFPWIESVRAEHKLGLDFKLHPRRTIAPPAGLMAEWREVTALAGKLWLWLEGKRLGRPFRAVVDYAADPADKCPEMPAWRSCLVNVRQFRGRAFGRGLTRYPRERMLRALALLLWEPAALRDAELRGLLQRDLQTQAASWPECVTAYTRLWERFR